MSRYKKVLTGEMELEEISGTKFLIYPTLERKAQLLEMLKTSQLQEEIDEKDPMTGRVIQTRRIKGKFLNLTDIAKLCAHVVYEGCFEHDARGVRIKIKDEEKDTTYDDILALILQSDILKLYFKILEVLDIIDNKKADELKKELPEEKKL